MNEESFSKPNIGIFELTGCGGCSEQILNLNTLLYDLNEFINIDYFDLFDHFSFDNIDFDIAIVSGIVANKKDEEYLNQIRKNSKCLIAIGLCANCSKKSDLVTPLTELVKIDYSLSCCPIDKMRFLDLIQRVIFGRNTFKSTSTLCGECKNCERGCMFGRGKLCSGLITTSGCEAICLQNNQPCRGCAGISVSSNIEQANCIASHVVQSSDYNSYDDFLSICSVDRFLNQDLNNLNKEDQLYVISRQSGKDSALLQLDFVAKNIQDSNIENPEYVDILKELIRLSTIAKNNITSLFFDSYKNIVNCKSFYDLLNSSIDDFKSILEIRELLDDMVVAICGRSIHPITIKRDGFSVLPNIDILLTLQDKISNKREEFLIWLDKFIDFKENNKIFINDGYQIKVVAQWDILTDVARFASAKAGLRPGKEQNKHSDIAYLIEIIDCIEKISATDLKKFANCL